MWRAAFTTVFAVLLVGVTATISDGAGASTSQTLLKAKALSIADMPSGWSVDNSPQAADPSSLGGCLKSLGAFKKPKGVVQVHVQFGQGSLPAVEEILEAGKGAAVRYDRFIQIMSTCATVSTTENGKRVTGSVDAMSFPAVADSSSAYNIHLSAKGVTVDMDTVYFELGSIDGSVTYESFSPDEATVQALVTEAINKIEGKPATLTSDLS